MISINYTEQGRMVLTVTGSDREAAESGSIITLNCRLSMHQLLSRIDDVPLPEQYQMALIDGCVNELIKKYLGTTRNQLNMTYQTKKSEWLNKAIGQRTGNRLRIPYTRIRPYKNTRLVNTRGSNE